MIYYLKGEFLRVQSKYSEKTQKTYYSAAVIQGTESITLAVSPEVAMELEGMERLTPLTFRFTEHLSSGPSGPWINRYCNGLGESED